MSLDEDEFTLGRRRPQITCVIIYPGIWIIVYLVGMGQQGELEQLREVEEWRLRDVPGLFPGAGS